MIEVTTSGLWLISNDSHICKWVKEANRLDHDQSTLPKIIPLIPEGGTVVDAGAFVGDHTVAYLNRVGREGRVIAFEPMRETFHCLVNNCPNAETYQLALGREFGTSRIHHDQNYGGAFLEGTDDGSNQVFIVPLDALELQRLDLLKLDCEGFEVEALAGAARTIAKCRPIILTEVNDGALQRQGIIPDDLYGSIALLGYRYEYLFPEHHMNMPQTDIICFPK